MKTMTMQAHDVLGVTITPVTAFDEDTDAIRGHSAFASRTIVIHFRDGGEQHIDVYAPGSTLPVEVQP